MLSRFLFSFSVLPRKNIPLLIKRAINRKSVRYYSNFSHLGDQEEYIDLK